MRVPKVTWRKSNEAPGLPETVRPMFDPPLVIVSWCMVTGGLAAVSPDGAVYCEPGRVYVGGANGQEFFAGHSAARIRRAVPNHPEFGNEVEAGKIYVIESRQGGSFHFPLG